MATKIQLRRDTDVSWSSNNPTLSQGEPGYDLTEKKLKIGDGVTNWNNLTYVGEPTEPLVEQLSDLDDVVVIGPSIGQILKFNGATWVNTSDKDTTYSLSTETVTNGASIRLTSSELLNDDVSIVAGSNVTITKIDNNSIGISSTDTIPNNATITINAGKGLTGGGSFTVNQSLSEAISFAVGSNSIGTDELNVEGPGVVGQILTSDGDGTLRWTTPTNKIDIIDNNSIDEEKFLTHVDQNTGSVSEVGVSSSNLSYNPEAGRLTVPSAFFTSTGAVIMPVGNTAQRPLNPVIGMIRFNIDIASFEGYNGNDWVDIQFSETFEGDLNILSGSVDLEEGSGTVDLMA